MPQKNYLFGGIMLCVFPVIVLFACYTNGFVAYSNGKEVPFPVWVFIFLAVCFFWGVWTVMLSLFKLDMQGAAHYFACSIMVAGIAAMFFVVAWREKEGWSSNMPFIPAAWNQITARLLFALGGVLASIVAAALLRKAARRCGKG